MKSFVVYNKTTGEIERKIKCSSAELAQKQTCGDSNLLVMEGDASDDTHVVQNGKAKLRTKAQRTAFESRQQLGQDQQGNLSKVEKILKYMKSKGADLGPAGDYL